MKYTGVWYMFLDSTLVIRRFIAVMYYASRKAKEKELDVRQVLAQLAKLDGWIGRTAWLLLTNDERLELVKTWIESGVEPERSLIHEIERSTVILTH